MEALAVPVPFFLLAFLSRQLPRTSGGLLLRLVAAGAWWLPPALTGVGC